MAFTARYLATQKQREEWAEYQDSLSKEYLDWKSNTDFSIVHKPSLGKFYKTLARAEIILFLENHPTIVRFSYCFDFFRTLTKKTPVWYAKKLQKGKYQFCIYKVNLTITTVNHLNNPHFIYTKPKDGKKGRVMLVPITGGKGNRKSLTGVFHAEKIMTDEFDEMKRENGDDFPEAHQFIADYFMNIVEEVYGTINEYPTLEIKIFTPYYKRKLDQEYAIAQFRRMLKEKKETRSTDIADFFPNSSMSTSPPATPVVGGQPGYSGFSDVSEKMSDDTHNLVTDLLAKYAILKLVRADMLDKIENSTHAEKLDFQATLNEHGLQEQISVEGLSGSNYAVSIEAIDKDFDSDFADTVRIAGLIGVEVLDTYVVQYEGLRKRFAEDEDKLEKDTESAAPTSKRNRVEEDEEDDI